MKKILLALALFAAVTFTACTGKGSTETTTDTDSIEVVTDSVAVDSVEVAADSVAEVVEVPAE